LLRFLPFCLFSFCFVSFRCVCFPFCLFFFRFVAFLYVSFVFLFSFFVSFNCVSLRFVFISFLGLQIPVVVIVKIRVACSYLNPYTASLVRVYLLTTQFKLQQEPSTLRLIQTMSSNGGSVATLVCGGGLNRNTTMKHLIVHIDNLVCKLPSFGTKLPRESRSVVDSIHSSFTASPVSEVLPSL
jgi:hypothetical protein